MGGSLSGGVVVDGLVCPNFDRLGCLVWSDQMK